MIFTSKNTDRRVIVNLLLYWHNVNFITTAPQKCTKESKPRYLNFVLMSQDVKCPAWIIGSLNHWIIGPLGHWIIEILDHLIQIGPFDHWKIKPSDQWTIRNLNSWKIGPLDHWKIGTLDQRTIELFGKLDHWNIETIDHWTIGPAFAVSMLVS